jgi:deoxyribonuclease-4
MTKFGAHVSAAGSPDLAPDNAKNLDCEVFQFFSRSPRGGPAKPISEETAKSFRNKSEKYGMESYIHAPYYINFASQNNKISFGSVSAIQEELRRGTMLGVKYVMTHLGSEKDLGAEKALKQVSERVREIFAKKEKWTTKLLLENSAGAKGVVGDNFEELGNIINSQDVEIGVCLDTCHLFASGYDIRDEKGIESTLKEFKKYLPLEKIKLVHANDSKFGLNEHKDRHADIGDGELGLETFKNLLANKTFQKINFILETPGGDERQVSDIAKLKMLRDNMEKHRNK